MPGRHFFPHSHSTCFERDKWHFFTNSPKCCINLFEMNGVSWVKVSQLTTPSCKELGTGPVAFSTVCLWQLLSQGTGPSTTARHSCPLSLWTVASHTPAEASCPERLTVPVVEASFLIWERQGDILSCTMLSSLQHISLQLDEKQSFQNNIHIGCNYGRSHKAIKVSLLQSLLESVVSCHIIKS